MGRRSGDDFPEGRLGRKRFLRYREADRDHCTWRNLDEAHGQIHFRDGHALWMEGVYCGWPVVLRKRSECEFLTATRIHVVGDEKSPVAMMKHG